jgi:hypothetical protein
VQAIELRLPRFAQVQIGEKALNAERHIAHKRLFAVIDTAIKDGSENDGTAVSYWAYNSLGDNFPPLVPVTAHAVVSKGGEDGEAHRYPADRAAFKAGGPINQDEPAYFLRFSSDLYL